jgi:hypothetical protein
VRIPLPVLNGIVAGEVTLAFRRWDRPRARAGASHRTPVGLIAIDAVDVVRLAGRSGRIYRMRVRFAGADPRIALRAADGLTDEDVATLQARLDRLDRASNHGAWTRDVLELIAANPARRAPDLAVIRGMTTQPFKTDVRKLKELGLTESLEVGYRISPRGQVFLDRTR